MRRLVIGLLALVSPFSVYAAERLVVAGGSQENLPVPPNKMGWLKL
ncbi:hypothetical protein [Escherichia coli]|nr:hypothetical protein [Escherichia coli]